MRENRGEGYIMEGGGRGRGQGVGEGGSRGRWGQGKVGAATKGCFSFECMIHKVNFRYPNYKIRFYTLLISVS